MFIVGLKETSDGIFYLRVFYFCFLVLFFFLFFLTMIFFFFLCTTSLVICIHTWYIYYGLINVFSVKIMRTLMACMGERGGIFCSRAVGRPAGWWVGSPSAEQGWLWCGWRPTKNDRYPQQHTEPIKLPCSRCLRTQTGVLRSFICFSFALKMTRLRSRGGGKTSHSKNITHVCKMYGVPFECCGAHRSAPH